MFGLSVAEARGCAYVALPLQERPMTRAPALLLIAGVLVMGARPAQAQFEDVGSFEFPTSSTPEAEQHFLRGVSKHLLPGGVDIRESGIFVQPKYQVLRCFHQAAVL